MPAPEARPGPSPVEFGTPSAVCTAALATEATTVRVPSTGVDHTGTATAIDDTIEITLSTHPPVEFGLHTATGGCSSGDASLHDHTGTVTAIGDDDAFEITLSTHAPVEFGLHTTTGGCSLGDAFSKPPWLKSLAEITEIQQCSYV
jgi:hypothetical protein